MKKRDGHNRPVVNLENLNSNIPYQHFKMEGLLVSKEMLFPGHKMWKIDLKDDYFVFPVSKPNVDMTIYLDNMLLITSSLEDF